MTDAIIKTSFGNIKFKLMSDIAPETVRNFSQLAKSGFYNGTLFHRIIPGFMIQVEIQIPKILTKVRGDKADLAII